MIVSLHRHQSYGHLHFWSFLCLLVGPVASSDALGEGLHRRQSRPCYWNHVNGAIGFDLRSLAIDETCDMGCKLSIEIRDKVHIELDD